MENYTKYKLKGIEALEPYLAGADRLFVVACNKCFKEFTTVEEPDCAELCRMAEERGKTVTGAIRVDFLCNRTQTEKQLKDAIPAEAERVFVISCGLGVQTVAELADKPVFAAADTLNYRGHHGMALTAKRCEACAQCYLNLTGGICPVVDCSKSLLNGQCGGAKDGKCEVDPERDCAWEKIQQRLQAQGRLAEFQTQSVQLRDFGKVDHKLIQSYVNSIRESWFAGYYGGVHPLERKEMTEGLALRRFPAPETVVIPLSMHSGAPANPVVQVGDAVQVGQKIGEAAAFISGNVHSSVSGVVTAIEPCLHPTRGGEVLSVVIRSDGKDTLHSSVKPHKPVDQLTPEEIVEIVRESGIVGMGGAGFPTSVKLKPGKPIDAVLLNGCECEPLLTADHRVLLEYADEVIVGLQAVMKAVDAPRGCIVIEDNKPDAIALLTEKIGGLAGIEVITAKTKYPQGAEKMLIKRVLGRQVPRGGLPADVGAVVCNISSVKAIADAIQLGMPLVERVVTVTGERIARPGNYLVKIGTNVQDILDHCGGVTRADAVIKMGGPMMGTTLTSLNVPVIKSTNGLIAVDGDGAEEHPCIKCGRCVDVCPMELKPLYLAKYADEGNVEGLKAENVRDCMECRSCQYICSAKIRLIDKIRAGKKAVMEVK